MLSEIISRGGNLYNLKYASPELRAASIMQLETYLMAGTNLLVNPDFESGTPGNPTGWRAYQTGAAAAFTYPEPGRLGGSSIAVSYPAVETGRNAVWIQDVIVNPSTTYEISGYMMTNAVVGTGAIWAIDWYTSSMAYIGESVPKTVTGTTGWTSYTGSVVSPPNAALAHVVLGIRNASGKAWFDDMSFIEGAAVSQTYNCVNGACQPAPAGTTGTYPDLSSCTAACSAGGGGGGTGIPTTYVIAGVGILAVGVLAAIALKSKKK